MTISLQRRTSKVRRGAVIFLVCLVSLAACAASAPAAKIPIGGCNASFSGGETRLYHKGPDANGTTLEIWCRQSSFWSGANYVFLVRRWGREAVVAGTCLLRRGQNIASYVTDDASNIITGTRWVSEEHSGEFTEQHDFYYDLETNKLRISKRINDTQRVMVIEPPASLEKLEEYLNASCADSCSPHELPPS